MRCDLDDCSYAQGSYSHNTLRILVCPLPASSAEACDEGLNVRIGCWMKLHDGRSELDDLFDLMPYTPFIVFAFMAAWTWAGLKGRKRCLEVESLFPPGGAFVFVNGGNEFPRFRAR